MADGKEADIDALCATFRERAQVVPPSHQFGRVQKSVGLLLEVVGLDASLGDTCLIHVTPGPVLAEVVGFARDLSLLMPLGHVQGLRPGAQVQLVSRPPAPLHLLLGRVVDALGDALDGGPEITRNPQDPGAPPPHDPLTNPLRRTPISATLDVGVRSINALLRVGVGQRVGLFAGSGVGKSVLLGMLARFADADVVVVGLIGERGREVREFVSENMRESLPKAVVVASPADESPALRLRAAWLATTIAEQHRAAGKRVLLLLDSLTRVAQAQREIGLSLGEPPAAKGYTPSVFALLPRLVERAGCGVEGGGSITAFYTVLMEEDDLQDPVVDAARSILDGHIVLSRRLADQGLYPAIDVSGSISRVMNQLGQPEALAQARWFRARWSRYHEQEDLISVGAYQRGSDTVTDEAIAYYPKMRDFVAQDAGTAVSLDSALGSLRELADVVAPERAAQLKLPARGEPVAAPPVQEPGANKGFA